MSARSFILFAHGSTRQIATVVGERATFTDISLTKEQAEAPAGIAQRFAEELRRLGYAGEGVMLAVASADCLAASIEIAELPRGDRKAMLYRLEEKLPLAAESIVADFVAGEGRAVGVCARLDAIAPLLGTLENSAVAVQSVCPVGLLAAQKLGSSGGGAQVLLIGEEGQINVVVMNEGVTTGWSLLPMRAADLRLHLDMLAMERGEEMWIRCAGVKKGLVESALGAGEVEYIASEARQAAAIAGAAVLGGRRKAWVEFRRGPLAISDPLRVHRSALDAALVTAAIFLVCLTVGMLWRAHRYERAAEAAQQKMVDGFVATFPGRSAPANVRSMVEAEARKLAGRGGGSSGTDALPPQASESALLMLYTVLGNLPAEMQFKVEQMTFGDGSFTLEGRVRAIADADAIAAAVRSARLDVAVPPARRDADGYYTVTLRGTRPAAAAASAAASRGGAPMAEK